MKYTYEEKPELNVVIRTSEDGEIACIPMSEANSDYQRYLNPEAEQSTPIVIDETSTK
jgi:hypothetical protein